MVSPVRSWLSAAALLCLVGVSVVGARRVKKSSVSFEGYSNDPNIVTVTQESFRQHVMDPSLPVLLTFYATDCPNCGIAAGAIRNASVALAGHVLFGAFDGGKDEQSKGLAEMFGAAQFPSILLFNPEMMPVQGQPEGSFMKVPLGYSGSVNTETLVRWILESISSRSLSIVEDADDLTAFHKRFQSFDLPKLLLLTQSNFTAPNFRTLSHKLRYGAGFGVSRSLSFIQSQFGLSADDLPAVAVWTSITESPEFIAVKEMTLKQLEEALGKYATPEAKRREIQSQYIVAEVEEAKREAEEAKRVRAHPPVVARTRDDFTKLCRKRAKGFCVLCFVEDVNNPSMMEWLETASQKMAQRSKQESQLVVVDANKNLALANHFSAAENGFPSVVYFNPSKRVYYSHIGAFNERAIVSFWSDRLSKAKAKTVPKKIPRFVGDEDDTKAQGTDASQNQQQNDDIGVGDEL